MPQEPPQGPQRDHHRPQHPSKTMLERMLASDSLMEGTTTVLRAMLETPGSGPPYEGLTAFLTVWTEAIKMAEDREEGAQEVTSRALNQALGSWDLLAGPSTRSRILRLVEEQVEQYKRDERERREEMQD